MSEKGGKGFSQPKPAKSALKPPASKGKDDSSAKSKRDKRVQLNEDSLDGSFTKSNGNSDKPLPKGDLGKGVKGDKGGGGGKTQTTKPPPPLELRVEQELPDNTICLMDCEAAEILRGIQEQMVVLSEDPAIKLPISFDRGLTYALRHEVYENPQAVEQIFKPLKEHGVSDGELCMIANFHMESVDEVFALVPSLKANKSKLKDPLNTVLGELAKLKNSA